MGNQWRQETAIDTKFGNWPCEGMPMVTKKLYRLAVLKCHEGVTKHHDIVSRNI